MGCPFLDDLSGQFTVYAPAHPGTASDPDAVRNIRGLWELVLYYYELFDNLGLRSPAVVGYSFGGGGMVAAEVAATNPERVSKLFLMASIGLWRDDHPVQDSMGTFCGSSGDLLPAVPTAGSVSCRGRDRREVA